MTGRARHTISREGSIGGFHIQQMIPCKELTGVCFELTLAHDSMAAQAEVLHERLRIARVAFQHRMQGIFGVQLREEDGVSA